MDKEIALRIIAENKKVYDLVAKNFSLTRTKGWPEFEYFKGYLKDGQDILDLGCGNGRLTELLDKYNINYFGIDYSEKLINEAQKKYPDKKFLVGDILDFSFFNQKYDHVFLIATLHHIPSDEYRLLLLNNIKKVLKPGGSLLMTNWNLWQKRYLKYIIKYSLLKMSQPNKEIMPGVLVKDIEFQDVFLQFFQKKYKRYVHAFTEFNIANLLKKTDFDIIKNVSNKRNIITIARLPK